MTSPNPGGKERNQGMESKPIYPVRNLIKTSCLLRKKNVHIVIHTHKINFTGD